MNIDPIPATPTTPSSLPASEKPTDDVPDKPLDLSSLPQPSGRNIPELAGFDEAVQKLLVKQDIPGAALAIGKGGKLLLARGYGWGDRTNKVEMPLNALFRVASISKPITAHIILKLANRGLFKLDDFVTQHLPEEFSFAISAVDDERWFLVTIRQLLQHTGGWDREETDFDPMFESELIASAASEDSPASIPEIIRYMLGRPLDFHPGTRYAYSNFGYCLLGRVIETVTGKPYVAVAREELWDPLGLSGEFTLGATLESGRQPREVRYFPSDDTLEPGVFPVNKGMMVSPPYGGFCLEAMDAHGGWLGSAPGLVLWSMSLEPPMRGWLRAETWIDVFKPPAPPASRNSDGVLDAVYYGLGWQVRPTNERGGFHRWHAGSLPGVSTLLLKRDDDVHIAILFNRRHENRQKTPVRLIDADLHRLSDAVEHWPDHDLTPELFPG